MYTKARKQSSGKHVPAKGLCHDRKLIQSTPSIGLLGIKIAQQSLSCQALRLLTYTHLTMASGLQVICVLH